MDFFFLVVFYVFASNFMDFCSLLFLLLALYLICPFSSFLMPLT